MIQKAAAADEPEVAALLHALTTEFGDPTPGAVLLAERVGAAIEAGEVIAC